MRSRRERGGAPRRTSTALLQDPEPIGIATNGSAIDLLGVGGVARAVGT